MKTKARPVLLIGAFLILVLSAFVVYQNLKQEEMKEQPIVGFSYAYEVKKQPLIEYEELLQHIEENLAEEESKRIEQEAIVNQINKSLTSTIADKGELFVSYSIEKGVDPYLSVAIVLLETGCTWGCSSLVTECNNVGGQHGNPSCGDGPYARFETLDDGIIAFIDNLSDNYIQMGLETPEQINTKYATSKTWARKVNNYIKDLKSK